MAPPHMPVSSPLVMHQIVNWFAFGLLIFLFIIGPVLLYRDYQKHKKIRWAILIYPWAIAVALYLLFQSITIYG